MMKPALMFEQSLSATSNPHEYSVLVPLSQNDSLPRGYFSAREEVGKPPYIPQQFTLIQNYPNPFNGITTITFESPGRETVELRVFNILGQYIKTLYQGRPSVGAHILTWDGTNAQGIHVATGVYFIFLKTSSTITAKKMLYFK